MNEFEYLFDLFFRKQYITESEINMFFRGNIIPTCNNDQARKTVSLKEGPNR